MKRRPVSAAVPEGGIDDDIRAMCGTFDASRFESDVALASDSRAMKGDPLLLRWRPMADDINRDVRRAIRNTESALNYYWYVLKGRL